MKMRQILIGIHLYVDDSETRRCKIWHERKRKEKVRWGRVLGALLLIGIFMVGLFNVFQYIEGTIKAFNQPLKKVEGESFVSKERKIK